MTARLFVALEPSERIRDVVAAAREALTGMFPHANIRWQPLANLHLTLAFLGNVPDERIGACADRLEACTHRASRFEAATTHLGAFPSPVRPSVVWLGIDASPASALVALQRDVAHAFRDLHEDRKPFRPHLTLGRVKGLHASDRTAFAAALAGLPVDRASWRVERAVLFASTLTSEGAIHTPVRTGTIPP